MLKVSKIIIASFVKNAPKTFTCYCRTCATSAVPKEEKLEVYGQKINYLKVGTGPHHVLCNPGVLSPACLSFRPQREGMDRTHFTLVIWDPPGYGKSRPPEAEFLQGHIEKNADFAHGLMEALNIPRYSVLGFSNGSAISMILAAKYPECIKKLVLWGAKSFCLPHELELHQKFKNVSQWPERFAEFLKKVTDAYDGDEVFQRGFPKYVQSIEVQFHANNGDICSSWLKDIKCPTFILAGAKDPVADISHVSYLNKHIVNSRTYIYPEGGHILHQYSEDFNKRVQEFLLE